VDTKDSEIVKFSPNSILLIVSNPVEILTYIAYKLSGFPSSRVIGAGTVLDTSRLKYMLSQRFEVDARNIHTYIMGEHGDSEIASWSLTSIAGMNIDEYCEISSEKCDENSILTVSSLLKGDYGIQDVYMGVPTIISREGVKKVLQVRLNEDEKNQLATSSKVLKTVMKDSKI